MLDSPAAPTETTRMVIQFGALVFGATPADHALQIMADSLGVSTVALGRIETQGRILAINSEGPDLQAGWDTGATLPNVLLIDLCVDPGDDLSTRRDVFVAQSRVLPLTREHFRMLSALGPYMKGFWAARNPNLDRGFHLTRTEATQSLLHPDNPYGLTRTEIRVCSLIAKGMRPQTMADTLGTSITTIRTHLRHIYTKTGLDGMVSVMHHLQTHSCVDVPAP